MRGSWMAARVVCASALLASGAVPEVAASQAGGALVAVNGTELFVRRVGAGEPVLVVHGGPVMEHGYLLPYLEPLAERHELVFFDQRLSGRSAGTVDAESVRVATFVDDIEALRQTLGLDRVHLLGHSWGGLLAMHYAIRYPEALRSLILLDSAAASSAHLQQEQQVVGERADAEFQRRRAELAASEAFTSREPRAIADMLRLAFELQFAQPARAAELELYVPDDYAERSRQFGAMAPELSEFDLLDDLAQVRVAALVLYGDAEPGAQIGGPAIADALPSAEFVLIADAGHFPFLEQPEAFHGVLAGFFDQLAVTR